MKIRFYKYQGAGNDFILIDCREKKIKLSTRQIAHLCHRQFGIGADGLMYLQKERGYDFKMVYFNSDGNESSMCGNGGRCIVAFALNLGLIKNKTKFLAIDGAHTATVNKDGSVSLAMQDVKKIKHGDSFADWILDTGSPHYVHFVKDVNSVDVVKEGRAIRNSKEFKAKGINVNFAMYDTAKKVLNVRTYERGVENETLSCGTGVVASAIAAQFVSKGKFKTNIQTPGGRLQVSFKKDKENSATNVVLTGPAEFVFEGEVEV
jgi:diaminopimelate epimerase